MKNDAVKAPNRSNLFNDCLTGVACVVLLFILVSCAALAVKERTCTIRFTDPLTGEYTMYCGHCGAKMGDSQ